MRTIIEHFELKCYDVGLHIFPMVNQVNTLHLIIVLDERIKKFGVAYFTCVEVLIPQVVDFLKFITWF